MAPQSRLLIRDGVIEDKSVKISTDSGASTDLIKPGLASKVLSKKKVHARRFYGTWILSQHTKEVHHTIRIEGVNFPKMHFTILELPKTHGSILD